MLGSSEEGFDEDVGGCTISPLREFKAYIQLYGPAKDSISLSLPPQRKDPSLFQAWCRIRCRWSNVRASVIGRHEAQHAARGGAEYIDVEPSDSSGANPFRNLRYAILRVKIIQPGAIRVGEVQG